MKTVFLIEELWIDSMENSYSDALGYTPIGVVEDRETAEAMVRDLGDVEGTGWPISTGVSNPRLRMREVPYL